MRLLPCLLLTGCLITDRMVDALLDADGDGERTVLVGGRDCDDHDGAVGPGRKEICHNGKDDDCDGLVDDVGIGADPYWVDRDHDGYGEIGDPVWRCTAEPGFAPVTGDCDDFNQERHPGAEEVCGNGVDDDCDPEPEDELGPLWWPDRDGDGQGDANARGVPACIPPDGHVTNNHDCDDDDPRIHRGAEEIYYDGIDQDCDAFRFEYDRDRDGFEVDPMFVNDPSYVPKTEPDCDDDDPTIHPGAKERWYDGIDQDCQGDDDFDRDGDGHRSADYGGDDCDDRLPERRPGLPDACYDGFDADCDDQWEYDCDRDGHRAVAFGGDDCDDADPNVWAQCASCDDDDGDGRYAGCDAYVTVEPDCDDHNNEVWVSCATCGDADGDGFWAGCDFYDRHAKDCDDSDPRVWVRCGSCEDLDGDGRAVGCDAPGGDCDDELVNAWTSCDGCVDADGDGYGVGACESGEPVDCDDADPDVYESCGSCVDLDGDGARTGCDRYLRTPYDCDDTDPTVGGHVFEILEDGIDQDCDGADLTVSEEYGLFVAPSGVDVPSCGTRARPCATPAYAAVRARWRGGKALWLAEGVYGGFEAWGSVYGGFEEGTWERGGRTIINMTEGSPVRIYGATAVVSELDIYRSRLVGGIAGLELRSTFSWLRNVTIENLTSNDCAIVRAYGTKLLISDVVLSGCGGEGRSTGLWLEGPGMVANVDRTVIDLYSPMRVGDFTGVFVRAGQHQLLLNHTDVRLGGVKTATGIRVDSGGLVDLHASSVEVTAEDEALGIWSRNATLRLRSAVVDVNGNGAFGLAIEHTSTEVAGSVVRADGANSATLFGGSSGVPLDVFASTLIARGQGARAISLPPMAPATFVNTMFVSDGVPWTAHEAYVSLDHVLVDAPCASFSPQTGECEIRNNWIESCTWSGCAAAHGVLETRALLKAVPWYCPSGASPAIDAGKEPATGAWNYDVDYKPRPSGGGWDIGACEM